MAVKASGCWIRMSGWHRMMGMMMSRMMMSRSFSHEDFDDGRWRAFGSFHVPHDYLFDGRFTRLSEILSRV